MPRSTICWSPDSAAGGDNATDMASSSLARFAVVAHGGQIAVRIRPEIAQADELLAAGVLECHSLGRALGCDEDFILRDLAEADEVRAVDGELADRSAPLNYDQAESARVLDRGRAARLDRQLAGAEELLAV